MCFVEVVFTTSKTIFLKSFKENSFWQQLQFSLLILILLLSFNVHRILHYSLAEKSSRNEWEVGETGMMCEEGSDKVRTQVIAGTMFRASASLGSRLSISLYKILWLEYTKALSNWNSYWGIVFFPVIRNEIMNRIRVFPSSRLRPGMFWLISSSPPGRCRDNFLPYTLLFWIIIIIWFDTKQFE